MADNVLDRRARAAEWFDVTDVPDSAFENELSDLPPLQFEASSLKLLASRALETEVRFTFEQPSRELNAALEEVRRKLRATLGQERRESRLERRFGDLVRQWKDDMVLESSLTRMFMDRSYQQIIGLGPPAVPLLLRELEREPDHWFWALTSITGEDPASDTDTLDEATDRWLDWGRSRGYIE